MSDKKLAVNERIKTESNFLRGTIAEGLADQITGGLSDDDMQLTKFHGFYQQDDRDIRAERQKQKLEPRHSFMLRARVPGGICSPEQWLEIDRIASDLTIYGSIRLTTRQTFQYHGILKPQVKPLIQALGSVNLDSIAACGDVNRNVMCTPNPVESALHQEAYAWAIRLSDDLLPNTNAYAELWLDGEKVHSNEAEPMYGPTYLPRKFKIAVAIPPHNDVDIHANDLNFVAVGDNGKLAGFNVLVGGGMGTTHGDVNTFPRLADDFGFVKPEDAVEIAKAVLTVQRDWGCRTDRKRARLKYTLEDNGVDKFRAEVELRSGIKFEAPKAIEFTTRGDRFGWIKGVDNKWHLTLFIENGRIVDTETHPIKTGLVEIAKIHQGDFRMTANQNLIIAGVAEQDKEQIERLARLYGLYSDELSQQRLNSMACVALPTCALAMAEAERYLPSLVTKVEGLLTKHGIPDEHFVMRMTGCPNGCGRPFLAEVGFVGKGPGKYNMYLGAKNNGMRLNKMYRENIGETEILTILDELIAEWATNALPDERFGDFVVRREVIKPVIIASRDFHG
ncbi:assimilatory sulfite reductase (NADPH) hemoprotein subunit [Moritella sp. 5]|uniref:assimilatory sulfite reductase (NADPH) hemoprotein subunit n=1 Tax=Moritella sp. 5 TaxID=2746231 RepID=UPI001BAA1CEB|nr:assimilatory sulfite reductase (NADPH) hemoprotein subunit [Moritella sp. 5]QUM82259.1 assimilatory sulfite reductase (NADPH) hemoprotein subunit [Moritella sp. 5]